MASLLPGGSVLVTGLRWCSLRDKRSSDGNRGTAPRGSFRVRMIESRLALLDGPAHEHWPTWNVSPRLRAENLSFKSCEPVEDV